MTQKQPSAYPLRIPPKLKAQLEEHCKKLEKPMSQVILDAIRKEIQL